MREVSAEPDLVTVSERDLRWRNWISEVASGDSQALARLYDDSSSTLYGLALRIMKNDADAEEVILEVYEKVWRTASTFDPVRGSASRWLTLLTRSKALDRLRSAASRRDRQHFSIAEDWDLASADPSPDSATLFQEERLRLRSAMQKLPPEQRQALELAFFSGLTHAEVAVSLSLPLGTVKTRIRSAMDKLRNSFTQDDFVPAGSIR